MYSSFKQFLVEEEKTVYFTFGRMNPPTIGHGKLLDALSKKASKNPYRVFLSQSADPKKNPLSYQDKIKAVRKMFPRHARSIMLNKNVRNAMEAASVMYNEGFKNLVMVVGSDRMNEFSALLKKYNGKEGRHGFYNFKNINVVSAGDRDPDAEGVEGMSASKMRKFAQENDFTSFSQGLPKTVSNADAKKMFNDVRKGMGLKEQKEFKNHIQLETVSETREQFVSGDLFSTGDKVIIKKSDEVGTISVIGANYVIIECDTKTVRKWIDDVELIEKSMYKDKPDWGTPESTKKAKKITPCEVSEDERKKDSPQDPDIKDRPGTQPKAYHSGLSKKTKTDRDRHFKKHAKMDDDNPKAYKKAPGDATAKTKPSKHTLKFKQMYGNKE
jgi:nicotinamide mononucleotide adenylyltransferase